MLTVQEKKRKTTKSIVYFSRYVIPVPTGVFPKSAKERQLSFQERKAEMIADAKKRYMEKHGLHVAMNC